MQKAPAYSNWYTRIVDGFHRFVASYIRYLGYVIMLLLVYEVFTRRVFNAPTDWNFFVTKFVYMVFFMLLAPYGLLIGANIRIDIFYANWSARTKALIDFIGMILVWIPEVLIVIYYGYRYAMQAYDIGEMTMSAGFQFPLWPFKMLFILSFVLLFFQSISQLFKLWAIISPKKAAVAGAGAAAAGKE